MSGEQPADEQPRVPYTTPDGRVYFPKDGLMMHPNGHFSRANLDDIIAAAGIDGKVDIRVVEQDGDTQRLSDGTYYDSEFGIHYE